MRINRISIHYVCPDCGYECYVKALPISKDDTFKIAPYGCPDPCKKHPYQGIPLNITIEEFYSEEEDASNPET